jgi:competence protein ComEC
VGVITATGRSIFDDRFAECEAEAEAAPRGALGRLLRDFGLAIEEERSRWVNWLPVVLGAGIGLYFLLPWEPPLIAALGLFVAAVVFRLMTRAGGAALVCSVMAALSAGFTLAKVRSEWVAAPVLERSYRAVEVRGRVEQIEPRPGRGERITLRLDRLGDLQPAELPRRARIRTIAVTPGLLPGDTIEFKARLAPPAEPVLPGGYNFARTAWFQQIGAVGFALQPARIVTEEADVSRSIPWRARVERLRRTISSRVRQVLPGETGAIAVALITGERGGVSEDTSDAFRNSGLFHILSISGLHMVVMAGAVFYAVRFILALFPPIALLYPIKKWGAVSALIAASLYLLISGAAFATQRSYLMIAIMFFAVLINRPAIAMRNVTLAALVILALYPESLLDAGFQMSFAAVIGLVAVYEWIRDRRSFHSGEKRSILFRPLLFFGGILLTTIVAGVAVAPFAAYHFHTSQQFALIANLIAIPVCNFVIMPAALLTFVLMPLGLEAAPLAIMGQGIEAVIRCAYWTASLPGAVVHVAQIPFVSFLLMAGGGLWLALWHGRWRFAGVAVSAIGVASAPLLYSPPDVLIGRGGELVAVRAENGQLAAIATRASDFELSRWLEQDGDGRLPSAAKSSKSFRCDDVGCHILTRAGILAVSKHPASLDDDCGAAAILIAAYSVPQGCHGPRAILDEKRLKAGGTHALRLSKEGRIELATVIAEEGERPWVRKPRSRPGPGVPGIEVKGKTSSRAGSAASSAQREAASEADLRPEVEDGFQAMNEAHQ